MLRLVFDDVAVVDGHVYFGLLSLLLLFNLLSFACRHGTMGLQHFLRRAQVLLDDLSALLLRSLFATVGVLRLILHGRAELLVLFLGLHDDDIADLLLSFHLTQYL